MGHPDFLAGGSDVGALDGPLAKGGKRRFSCRTSYNDVEQATTNTGVLHYVQDDGVETSNSPAAAVLLGKLFGFVCFEEGSRLFEVEEVSVYDHLVFAGVFRDVDDVLNCMALVSQGGDEKIDIYHAVEFTGFSF
jgi:hypothetical protein